MPTVLWKCEECHKTKEGTLKPPRGWCEISFWNEKNQRFHRYSFCSYSCAGSWASGRYDEPSEVRNG